MHQEAAAHVLSERDREAIYNADTESVSQKVQSWGRLLCWFMADSIFYDTDATYPWV